MILPKTFVNPYKFMFIRKTHIICPDFKICDYNNSGIKYILGYYDFSFCDENITQDCVGWYWVIEKLKTKEQQLWKPRYKI